ncbi:MAG TPA: Asd/ArgC dimerization domain-containing protein [Bryobacteraceae bacterium]|nr:Asd/ArgC dimerization domain-containing protein [Bryobacteraceae bacterium]
MDKAPVIAIVGGTSLLGRELRDLLAGLPLLTKLIGVDDAEAGTLTEQGGEPAIITALDEENLSGARVALLAGSAESSGKALDVVHRLKHGPALIDLTYLLEDHPSAHLRAPMVEPAHYAVPPDAEHVVAHPAAVLLAMLLVRINQVHTLRSAVAHVFEPASERGHRGIDELHKQTAGLLTFQKVPKDVFDEQAAFNLLARYGSEAHDSLEAIEMRIERHLATLLALNGTIPMPSLRLIQAPVFHGHSVSLRVEFDQNPGVLALEHGLAGAQIDVRGADLEPPNIVSIAGQSGIAVGAITADRNDPHAVWLWAVADNIRLQAENAVGVARALAGQPGHFGPQ